MSLCWLQFLLFGFPWEGSLSCLPSFLSILVKLRSKNFTLFGFAKGCNGRGSTSGKLISFLIYPPSVYFFWRRSTLLGIHGVQIRPLWPLGGWSFVGTLLGPGDLSSGESSSLVWVYWFYSLGGFCLVRYGTLLVSFLLLCVGFGHVSFPGSVERLSYIWKEKQCVLYPFCEGICLPTWVYTLIIYRGMSVSPLLCVLLGRLPYT